MNQILPARTGVRYNEAMSKSGNPASKPALSAAELRVLEESRTLRTQIEAAEARVLALAVEWADLHPAEDEGDEAFPSKHLPPVDYRSTATFALNLGLSDNAGTGLIQQSLELRQRLPKTWARLHAGGVQAWRVRRIADRTLHQKPDVAAALDDLVAPIAHKIGAITLDRLINETKMRLHPAETEEEQVAALDSRHVKLFSDITHEGVATIEIRADLKDALDFDRTVSELAAILGDLGYAEDLNVRRSLAIGILADPQAAADLLAGDADAVSRISKRKNIHLFVHLTPDTFTGENPFVRLDRNGGIPFLERSIRNWCGRTDTHLTITPVIDLNDTIAVGQYEIPDRLKNQINHRDLTCVFPHCHRPATKSDHDHIRPYDEDGPTDTNNLAALCRRHHRVKTHGQWRYQRLTPRTYLWTNNHGQQYLRDHQGTIEIRQVLGDSQASESWQARGRPSPTPTQVAS